MKKIFLLFFVFLFLLSSVSSLGVESITLVDSSTNKIISTYANLQEDTTVYFEDLPERINIVANLEDGTSSVKFYLDGQHIRTENSFPFSMFGDFFGNYYSWRPNARSYAVTIEPFDKNGGRGTQGDRFQLVLRFKNDDTPPPQAPPQDDGNDDADDSNDDSNDNSNDDSDDNNNDDSNDNSDDSNDNGSNNGGSDNSNDNNNDNNNDTNTPPANFDEDIIVDDVEILEADGDSFTVAWETSRVTSGVIVYGTTSDLGQDTGSGIFNSQTATTNHQIQVSGLSTGTVYFFRLEGVDEQNNAYQTRRYLTRTPGTTSDDGNDDDNNDQNNDNTDRITCPNNRPDPLSCGTAGPSVCGFDGTDEFTYANACSACSDTIIDSFETGDCQNEDLPGGADQYIRLVSPNGGLSDTKDFTLEISTSGVAQCRHGYFANARLDELDEWYLTLNDFDNTNSQIHTTLIQSAQIPQLDHTQSSSETRWIIICKADQYYVFEINAFGFDVQSNPPTDDNPGTNPPEIACPSPRPDASTCGTTGPSVCGLGTDGIDLTYANACTACVDTLVGSYHVGTCFNEDLPGNDDSGNDDTDDTPADDTPDQGGNNFDFGVLNFCIARSGWNQQGTCEQVIQNNMQINLNDIDYDFSILANGYGDELDSVMFFINGVHYNTEHVFPWSLNDDVLYFDIQKWEPQVGTYTLRAESYNTQFDKALTTGQGTQGQSAEVTFTITNADQSAPPPNDNPGTNPPEISCPSPRPDASTCGTSGPVVCGLGTDGIDLTYANACTACVDTLVGSYHVGSCINEGLPGTGGNDNSGNTGGSIDSSFSISGFYLTKEDNNPIRELQNGDVIYADEYDADVRIAARTSGSVADSVIFYRRGTYQNTEKGAPFTLFGSMQNLDYFGTQTVRARVYDVDCEYETDVCSGNEGVERSISLNIQRTNTGTPPVDDDSGSDSGNNDNSQDSGNTNTPPTSSLDIGIDRFYLVNTNTNEKIELITGGQNIDLADYNHPISIVAEGYGPIESTIVFVNSGSGLQYTRTENLAPWSINGDQNVDNVLPWYPTPGNYIIQFHPYSEDSDKTQAENGGRGTLGQIGSIALEIINSQPAPPTSDVPSSNILSTQTITPKTTRITPASIPAPNIEDRTRSGNKVGANGRTFYVPDGFQVNLFFDADANGIEQPRWMVLTPGGDVLITDKKRHNMHLLKDTNNDGVVDNHNTFATPGGNGLNLPLGMVFHNGYFYVANTDAVRRYPYSGGDTLSGWGTKIADIPSFGYNSHWTRNLIVHPNGNKLYLSVGSGQNVAVEQLPRASVVEMNLDGSGQTTFSYGLRNPVGMDFHPITQELYVANIERDRLGNNVPPDFFTRIRRGEFFGYPYTYITPNNRDTRVPSNPSEAAKTVIPDVLYQAHSTPIGMTFYDGNTFPAKYRNGAFVAQRGSWNRDPLSGYKVSFVPFGSNNRPLDGSYEDFMTGFLISGTNNVVGRPTGLLVMPDGSLLISDDYNGKIYRVQYVG